MTDTKKEKYEFRKKGSSYNMNVLNDEFKKVIDEIIANMNIDDEITNREIVLMLNKTLGIDLYDKAKYGKNFLPSDIPLTYLKDNKANMDSLNLTFEKRGNIITYFKKD